MFKGSAAQNKIATFCFEILSIFGMAAIAIAFCFTFLFRTVVVDGGSMNHTLYDKDRLIITAGIGKPEYGDIVVICQPNVLEKTLIKRVIATGGQTIDIDFNTGTVKVDGNVLDEPYIADPTTKSEGMTFPQTVPEGYVFVMGDNRLHSTDSRSPLVGMIREEYVMGRVVARMAPNFDLHVAEIDR